MVILMCEPLHAGGDRVYSQFFRSVERAAMNICLAIDHPVWEHESGNNVLVRADKITH